MDPDAMFRSVVPRLIAQYMGQFSTALSMEFNFKDAACESSPAPFPDRLAS